MEAKGSTFLKVTGILMIVFGAIALIVSIIAILGIAALAAFNDGTYDMTMLYVGGVFALISAVAEFVAGIIGVINAKLPHKANTCIVWGRCCCGYVYCRRNYQHDRRITVQCILSYLRSCYPCTLHYRRC